MRDLRRLLKYLRPHWPIFTLATFAMLIVGLLESAIGGLIVPIFDQAFVQGAGQRTSTIFGLQHLIPAGALRRLENDLDPADCFHARKGYRRVLLDLPDGADRAVGRAQVAAGSVQPSACAVRHFLRTTSHELSRFETCFQRGRNRDRGDEHDSRHAAREFHLDRLSVGILLLQLAADARLAGDCAGYRLS